MYRVEATAGKEFQLILTSASTALNHLVPAERVLIIPKGGCRRTR